MHGGPWLFRHHAVLVEEYDGLINVESVPLDSLRVWDRIMGLPDQLRNGPVAKPMASRMGEVLEVALGVNGLDYAKFVDIHV